jgi:hypothetical protein
MTQVMSKFSIGRFLVLVVLLTLTEILDQVLVGGLLNLVSCAMSLATGILLSLFFTWLVSKMMLQKLHIFALIWLNLFVIRFLSNYIEAYFFTNIFTSFTDFIIRMSIALGISLIEGTFIAFFSVNRYEESLNVSLKEYLSSRSHGSWITRIAAGSVVYFPIYFFFGMLIFPFVAVYYSDPSFGLKVPGFEVIIPLEFFRGFLYVIVLLPIMVSLKENGRTRFIALSLMLFIPGAFIPLILAPSLPPAIVPFHLVEILADSLVYGFALSRILRKPEVPFEI